MERLTLTIPNDLIAQAKHKAIDQNTSVSKVVTECLRRFVEDEQPHIVKDSKSAYNAKTTTDTGQG